MRRRTYGTVLVVYVYDVYVDQFVRELITLQFRGEVGIAVGRSSPPFSLAHRNIDTTKINQPLRMICRHPGVCVNPNTLRGKKQTKKRVGQDTYVVINDRRVHAAYPLKVVVALLRNLKTHVAVQPLVRNLHHTARAVQGKRENKTTVVRVSVR